MISESEAPDIEPVPVPILSSWESKQIKMADLVGEIQNGYSICIASCAATPEATIKVLTDDGKLADIGIVQMLPGGNLPHLFGNADRFRTWSCCSFHKTGVYENEGGEGLQESVVTKILPTHRQQKLKHVIPFVRLNMVQNPLFFLVAWLCVCNLAAGFSASPTVQPRTFVELIKPFEGKLTIPDRLPASFIHNWPTWVLEENGDLMRIPDEESDNGFLAPASIDELWQPIDLKRPQMKLALGFHVRAGEIRHVMPAVDVSYDGSHRNRGMCSVPRAYAWMDFGSIFSDEWDRFELKIFSRKQGENGEWDELASSEQDPMAKAVEKITVALADAPIEMENGSHIIHVVLENSDAVESPSSGHDLKVTLSEDSPDLIEEERQIGILQVAISTTMSGSDSEYLPKVYEPLYTDETLRNPLYARYKERQEEKKE